MTVAATAALLIQQRQQQETESQIRRIRQETERACREIRESGSLSPDFNSSSDPQPAPAGIPETASKRPEKKKPLWKRILHLR